MTMEAYRIYLLMLVTSGVLSCNKQSDNAVAVNQRRHDMELQKETAMALKEAKQAELAIVERNATSQRELAEIFERVEQNKNEKEIELAQIESNKTVVVMREQTEKVRVEKETAVALKETKQAELAIVERNATSQRELAEIFERVEQNKNEKELELARIESNKTVNVMREQTEKVRVEKETAVALKETKQAELAIVERNATSQRELAEIFERVEQNKNEKELELARIESNKTVNVMREQTQRVMVERDILKIQADKETTMAVLGVVVVVVLILVLTATWIFTRRTANYNRDERHAREADNDTEDSVINTSDTETAVDDLEATGIIESASQSAVDVTSRPTHPSDEFSLRTDGSSITHRFLGTSRAANWRQVD